MRNTHLFLMAIMVMATVNACKSGKNTGSSGKLPGTWQAQPVTVDGSSNEWPSPYPSYDSKSMIGYATSNDRQFLYITMETGDEMTQMKILKQGMTVYIDTDGKKGTDLALHYPMPSDNEEFELPGRNKGEKSERAMAARFDGVGQRIKKGANDATQFTLQGFKGCNGGYSITQKNECGIKVRVGIDEFKELIWEAAIPFKAIYGKDSLTSRDIGKPISVGFAIKGFKKPSGGDQGGGNPANMNNVTTGGMNGGRGMGTGGGRGGRGGGMRGNNTGQDATFESTKTWKQFGLTYQ